MAETELTPKELLHVLEQSTDPIKELMDKFSGEAMADAAAELLIALNAGSEEIGIEALEKLMEAVNAAVSEKLRTVSTGTLWRDDLKWLDKRLSDGETAREKLLRAVADDKPKALTPVFWHGVAERGPQFTAIAFKATEITHPHEAARLLVRLCRAALADQVEIEIKSTVDKFLAGREASVRTAFLNAVKHLPEMEKRKLMTHLDMSLMAELDLSALEHRGESFFYDKNAEQQKRDAKSKDVFEEVRRRLEKGEKPQ